MGLQAVGVAVGRDRRRRGVPPYCLRLDRRVCRCSAVRLWEINHYVEATFGTGADAQFRVVRESLRIRRADRARPGIAGAVSAQVQESLRLRAADEGGSLYPTPLARRREVLAFGDMVIGDAHRRFGGQYAGQSG